MLLVTLAAALLVISPAPPPSCPPTVADLGTASAPVTITAWLDPLTPGALALWVELRLLVHDFQGEVQVRIEPISPTLGDPTNERLLRWFVAATSAGVQEAALRLLDRDGRERLGLRLDHPTGQAAVTAELASLANQPDLALAALRPSPCHDARLAAAQANWRAQSRPGSAFLGRPPLYAVDDHPSFEDNASLERLRNEVGRVLQERRAKTISIEPRRPPNAHRGVSDRLVRPPATAGMVVGNIGAPHRLVIFAEHEAHPSLGGLGPALAYRRKAPGKLALQIIARGTTPAARELRRRLCAARHLGLELDWLRYLVRDPQMRGLGTQAHEAFKDRLDEAATAHACDEQEAILEPGPTGIQALPDGLWLDGTAVGQGELDAIEIQILRLEAAQHPLDAVFSAAMPVEL